MKTLGFPILKPLLKTGIKLGIVCILLAWLVRSGRLDFSQLKIFIDTPSIFVMNFAVWLGCYVLLGALRWSVLVHGLSLGLSYSRAVTLQLIGFFFNTAMPGAVGGDIIKALYVMREQKTTGRTRVLLTVLLDRVMGLAALLIIAGAGILFNCAFFYATPALWPMVAFVMIGNLAWILGFAAAFLPLGGRTDWIGKLLQRQLPGFKFLASIWEGLCAYRSQPKRILSAIGLSIIIQLVAAVYCWVVMQTITGISADPAVFATILSLGIMTTAVPLAPGGLGVGHVAFDRLFHLVGWTDGANVFNVIILGQLALHLLGVFPYLLYRGKLKDTMEEPSALPSH